MTYFLVVYFPERGTDARVHTFPFDSFEDAESFIEAAARYAKQTPTKIVEVIL